MGSSAHDGKKAKILVAEDDAAMRRIVVEALEKDGHAVEEAADGLEMVAKLALDAPWSWDFDLVVSDVRMPGASGIDLLERLRAGRRNTPVILMTAFGDTALRDLAADMGAVLLDKPFAVSSLRACVAGLLHHHAG